MTLPESIIAQLEVKPMTSQELALQLGYTDRHIRRTLKGMTGIFTRRIGRGIFYSITTAAPDAGHGAGNENVRNKIPDIADIRTNQGGNENQRKDYSQNTRHFCNTAQKIPDIADIPDIYTGHSGHESSAFTAQNRDLTPGRHRERPQSSPGCDLFQDCDNYEGDRHSCRSCPLSIATIERDTIQFVLVDQLFRDQLLRWAAALNWPVKDTRGTLWIYPGEHLTLQAGHDSVIFYSDEPGDLSIIEAWVRKHFENSYPDIKGLVARIHSPERLTRDELTVAVTHKPVIDAILASVGMHMGPNKTFYLKAPNTNVPGFKAYQHAGTLRIEFDCRNQFQAITALAMRQRLLTIMPDFPRAEGLFWEFLTDYYNPYEHPIVIDTGVDSIIGQISDMTSNIVQTFTAALTDALRDTRQAPMPPAPAEEPEISEEEEKKILETTGAMRAMMQALSEMDSFELEEILRTFATTMKLEERSVRVYLAAFAAWTRKNYRGSVIIEDLAPVLGGAGTPLSTAEIADALDSLKSAGLLIDHPTLEICFSPFGSRLGRKLVAKWRDA